MQRARRKMGSFCTFGAMAHSGTFFGHSGNRGPSTSHSELGSFCAIAISVAPGCTTLHGVAPGCMRARVQVVKELPLAASRIDARRGPTRVADRRALVREAASGKAPKNSAPLLHPN